MFIFFGGCENYSKNPLYAPTLNPFLGSKRVVTKMSQIMIYFFSL